jgi:hypothetical protein
VEFNLVESSESEINEQLKKYKNMSKLQLNISVEEGCEEKLEILLKTQDTMITNLRVVAYKLDADVLGQINRRYKTLYSLYLRWCRFSN